MRRGVWLVPALLLLGCGGSSDDSGSGGPQPEWIGANGIRLTKVAIYQGPERVLMQDGVSVPSTVPLVAGRPAFVRLFHQTDAAYDGQQVLARMQLAGQPPIEAVVGPLGPVSVQEDFGTSIGFHLTGDQVGPTLDYSVAFLQQGESANDNPAARWSEVVPVEGKKNTLRIVMVPYRYDADGSGRLPNLSPEQLEVFRHRFMGMYPVSNVELTVHEPVAWNQTISPTGQGWQQVGINLYSLRLSDNASDDVYYYGIFNPATSLYQYCGGGCLLGVTLLNDDPPDVGSVQLRLALGVGFDKEAPNTAAHEIGHSHGRGHVNCGYGVDPSSVDPGYPYAPNTIGGWGWDVLNALPIDPSHTDIMGYCENQWISDYNYGKLFVRTQNVNLESVVSVPGGIAYDVIAVDGLGSTAWLKDVRRSRPVAGKPLTVRAGASELQAIFVPYDHLPGGWLFVPAGAASQVSFELDGKTVTAGRP